MFRTSNPALRADTFSPAQSWDDLRAQGRDAGLPGDPTPEGEAVASAKEAARANRSVMTIQGSVNKTFFLLFLCMATALVSWNMTIGSWSSAGISPTMLLLGGMIGGLITAMVCIFKPRTAPVTAPLYALFQGFFVGGISAFYAMRFASVDASDGAVQLNTGLIFNAALVTFGILGGMLLGYSTRLIRPGPVFRKVVVTATLGALVYAAIALVASLFGSFSLISVYSPENGGLISIGFSLLLVGIASANLILDFELIEQGAAARAPAYMEWYGGFALLVTLVWLYIEVLRLLAKLKRE